MDEIKRNPKPQVLFEENRAAFNNAVAEGREADFSNQNLSDLDLTGFNLKNANLSGAYLRGANLGGQDLSGANLHGASLKQARVSGCLFPPEISAEEIRLSVDLGTRLRQIKG
ncbi:MAG: pentapeptide repeat-containing protein [Candidatus Adiutrix sp.]|jgi:uncharacterized protein YjbI with pentapeptide repeats|nr:pentapeptide repeat-containing protein [Candidatus Adiutrix sp.]